MLGKTVIAGLAKIVSVVVALFTIVQALYDAVRLWHKGERLSGLLTGISGVAGGVGAIFLLFTASVSWMGPVGWALIGIGVVAMVGQVIWNWLQAKKLQDEVKAVDLTNINAMTALA